MRKLFTLLTAVLLTLVVSAQEYGAVRPQKGKVFDPKNVISKNTYSQSRDLVSYDFTEESGTFTSISATGDTILPSGWDDGMFYLNLDGDFSFNYNLKEIHSFSVNTNGTLYLGDSVYVSYTNDLGSTSRNPVVAPLWDDLKFYFADSTGGLFYQIDINGNDTVLTREWNKVSRYGSSNDTLPVSFQIKLHSETDIIEIIYGDMSNAENWTTCSASIGINDMNGTDAEFISVTPGSPATISRTEANNSVSSSDVAGIASGTIYKFTPNFYTNDLAAVGITPLASEPGDIEMKVLVSNAGISVVNNYTVSLEINQGATNVYSSTKSMTDALESGEDTLITMDTWAGAAAGSYTAVLTVSLSGDGNSSNDVLTKEMKIAYYIPMQDGSDTTCNALFFDSGLDTADYQDDEDYTFTFYPETSGSFIQVTFLDFDIENGYDFLQIYNGTSTSDELIGTYTGTTSPGAIIGKNSEGALTFHFTSDGSVSHSGWVASVSCYTPPNHDLAVTNISPIAYQNGETVTPSVKIYNNGTNDESNFQIHVWDSLGTYDQTITVSETLASFAYGTYDMPDWNPTADTNKIFAAVILSGDEDNSNDTSEQMIYKVNPLYSWDAYASASGLADGSMLLDINSGNLFQISPYDADFLAAGDWTPWGWLGLFYNGKTLVKIDKNTGDLTTLATLNIGSPVGMTYDSKDNILYVADYDGSSSSRLYKVDMATGNAELIGTIGSYIIIGIAADANGNLYGIEINSDNLVSIDTATGAGTTIGGLGIDIGYAQDIGFDRNTNTLYGTLYSSTGGLYTIDVATGAATLVNTFGDELTCTAIPYSVPTSTVTVHVTDGTNNIEGAEVKFLFMGSDYVTDSTDASGNVTFNDFTPGGYVLQVSAPGFVTYSQNVSVSGDTTIEVVLETQKQVTFHVTNADGDNIENAAVTFGSNNGTTDANGEVVFTVDPGDYNYSISADGYVDASGSVTITADTTINVTLEAQKQVTFHVTNADGDNIENATVTLGSNNGTTDANGETSFTVDPGDYNYTVSASGYVSVNGSITVAADTTVEVTLEVAFVSANDKFNVYPNPAADKISVNNANGYTVEILNAEGKVVIRQEINSNTAEINLNDLNSGIYIIRFTDENEVITGKIIKK